MAVTPGRPQSRYHFPAFTQEFVGKGNSIGGSFAGGVSQFSEQWQFTQSAFPSVVSDILGYSTDGKTNRATGVNGTTMQRVLPTRCAQFPWLWASRVSGLEGIGSKGIELGLNGGVMAGWKMMRMTVQYETPPYEVKSDEIVKNADSNNSPAESQRYVIWKQTPSVEFVQSTIDSFSWPKQAHDRDLDIIQGSKGYALLVAKVRITANWIQVCDDWVRSGSNKFGNIEAALGTVNHKSFLDRPAGTMLFESYEATPRVEPVDPAVMNQIDRTSTIPRSWDITLNWAYFDPTDGGATASGISQAFDGTPRYGHNLAFDPITAKWWRPLLNTKGVTDSNGYWKYRESDHSKIFKHY